MPLVPGICTQCGATLSADNSKDCMICPYCGTPFIVEKAINHFQNTYNISNSVVNFYGDVSRDFVIRAGVLERYDGSDVVVTIPDNVTVIGSGAFAGCIALKEVIIPEGVVSIEGGAFMSCRALTEVVIPNTTKMIHDSAFEGCANLIRIILSKELEKIGGNAFAGCTSLEEISFTDELTIIDRAAFKGCINLKRIVWPQKLKEIGESAFAGCTCLVKVILPDSLQVIGSMAFDGCTNLRAVRTPNSEYSVPRRGIVLGATRSSSSNYGSLVFNNCDMLQEFDIPNESWKCILGSCAYFREQERKKAELIEQRKRNFVCIHCGGRFKGFFDQYCGKCGKPKDYT